jgi:peptide/nickel transport system substrate-binding protein
MIGAASSTAMASASSGLSALKKGGSVTIESVGTTWPAGLDPATNTLDVIDQSINDAIFGGLFLYGTNKQVEMDLATGYAFSDDHKVFTIQLRHGVKFQDGTPFDAAAVVASIKDSLLPANGCLCLSDFAPVTSVVAKGQFSVVITSNIPYPAILDAFLDEAPDWPYSPAALASEGQVAFDQNPVGAGPFEIVSNSQSATLVLRAYKGYWQKGEPYLDNLTIQSVSSDNTALAAVQAGTAQLAMGMTTPSLIKEGEQQFNKVQIPGVANEWVQVDAPTAPMTNPLAREAVYYATNAKEILTNQYLGFGSLGETPSGPDSLFYEKNIPSYRSYNLAKAQALVKQLGGLSFTLDYASNSSQNQVLAEALDNQWSQAGITVTLKPVTIPQYLAEQEDHGYQVQLSAGGDINPTLGIDGLADRVSGNIGGEEDPTIAGLINKTEQLASPTALQNLYTQIYEQINQQAFGPYLFVEPSVLIYSKSLAAVSPSLTEDGAEPTWTTLAYK